MYKMGAGSSKERKRLAAQMYLDTNPDVKINPTASTRSSAKISPTVATNPLATKSTSPVLSAKSINPPLSDAQANELLKRMRPNIRNRYLRDAKDVLRNARNVKANATRKNTMHALLQQEVAEKKFLEKQYNNRQKEANAAATAKGLPTNRQKISNEVNAYFKQAEADKQAAAAAAYVKSRKEHYAASSKNNARGPSVDNQEDTEALRAAAALIAQDIPANVKSQPEKERNAWLAIELDKALESGYFNRNGRVSVAVRKYLKKYKPSLFGITKKQRGYAAWRGVNALKATPANVAAGVTGVLTEEEELAAAEAAAEAEVARLKAELLNAERKGNNGTSNVSTWSNARREAAKAEYNAWEGRLSGFTRTNPYENHVKLSNNANRYGRVVRAANSKKMVDSNQLEENDKRLENIGNLEAEIPELISRRNMATKQSTYYNLDDEIKKKTAQLEALRANAQVRKNQLATSTALPSGPDSSNLPNNKLPNNNLYAESVAANTERRRLAAIAAANDPNGDPFAGGKSTRRKRRSGSKSSRKRK